MSFLNWFRKNNESNRQTAPSIHHQVSQVPFQKGSKLSSQSITVKLLHQFSDKPADLTITSTHIIGLSQLKIDLSKVTLTDPTINECVQLYPWKIVLTDDDFWYCFYFKSETTVREFSEEVHKQILKIREGRDDEDKTMKNEEKHGFKRMLGSEVTAKEPVQILSKISKMSSTLNDSLMTESSPMKTALPKFSPVRKAREFASESTESRKSSPSKSESLQLSPTPKLSPSKMSPSKSSISNFSQSKFSPSKLNFLQFSPQKSNLSLCFQLVNKVYNLESVIKNNNRELNDQMHKVRTDIHKQVGNIENMIKEHLENDGSNSNSRKTDSDLKNNVTDLNGRMTGLENSVKFCTEMTLQTNEFFKNLESERRVEKQRETKIANEREDKLLGIISKLTDDTKHELIKNENIKHQNKENTENDDL